MTLFSLLSLLSLLSLSLSLIQAWHGEVREERGVTANILNCRVRCVRRTTTHTGIGHGAKGVKAEKRSTKKKSSGEKEGQGTREGIR